MPTRAEVEVYQQDSEGVVYRVHQGWQDQAGVVEEPVGCWEVAHSASATVEE